MAYTLDTVRTIESIVAPRMGQHASTPLYEFKTEPMTHPFRKALLRVNITLSKVAPKNEDRYRLVSWLFGRPISSTYELTVSEVITFLRLAHPDDPIEIDPEFLALLYQGAAA